MSEKYDGIIVDLAKLDAVELEKVAKQCKALLSITRGKKQSSDTTRDDWLLDGVIYFINRINLGDSIPSDFRLRSNKSFARYFDRSANVRKFFESRLPDMSNSTKIALGRIIAKCLSKYIESFVPISFTSMLNNIGQAIDAFENSFPSYLEADMISVLISAFEHKEKSDA